MQILISSPTKKRGNNFSEWRASLCPAWSLMSVLLENTETGASQVDSLCYLPNTINIQRYRSHPHPFFTGILVKDEKNVLLIFIVDCFKNLL